MEVREEWLNNEYNGNHDQVALSKFAGKIKKPSPDAQELGFLFTFFRYRFCPGTRAHVAFCH